MTISIRTLAAGPGWSVRDLVCTAGPGDRAFEERHDAMSVALVTRGSFQYRTRQGRATLAPGAVLLGNEGAGFCCAHDHAAGDRCLAFNYAAERLEQVVEATPGARRLGFSAAALPADAALLPVFAAAEAACDADDPAAWEELALRVASRVLVALAEASPAPRQPTPQDERRITRALRRIEAEPDAPLGLDTLAAEAAMSPYHFLRTFRAVVGMTPHQYLLRARLQRAAVRLRSSAETVAAVAFEAGFSDLSTFNHRFRRLFGMTPRAWRTVHASDRGFGAAPSRPI